MLTLTLTVTPMLTPNRNPKANHIGNTNSDANPKFLKKERREVAKVGVEPKSNGIPDLKHNRYATSSTSIVYQTDLIRIASCHETECSTGGTIAPADLLPPEYQW